MAAEYGFDENNNCMCMNSKKNYNTDDLLKMLGAA